MAKKTRSEVLDFLGVAEVAKLLGRHRNMVQRYAVSGAIPAIRAGSRWLFRREDVLGWRPPRKPGRPKKEKGGAS